MARLSLVNCNGVTKKGDPTKRQVSLYLCESELDLMQRWGYRTVQQGSGHRAQLEWCESSRVFRITHDLSEDGVSITHVDGSVDYNVVMRFGLRHHDLDALPNFAACDVDITRVNGAVIVELPVVNELPVPDYKPIAGHPLDGWQRAEVDFVRRWALLGSWPLFPRHLVKHLPQEARVFCQQGNFAAARQVVVARKQLVKPTVSSAYKTIAGPGTASHNA